MTDLSDYYEDKIIDHLFRNVAFTPPATVYVALFTVAPSDSGGGTEVSGGAYARQDAGFSAASGGATSNAADITYPTATANWGTVTHVGVFDALTVGNLLAWGALTASKIVDNGDTFKINATDLDLTID